jgi:hypothetical protein
MEGAAMQRFVVVLVVIFLAAAVRHLNVELYRRSLELNPDNTNSTQAIERLSAGVPADRSGP